MVSSAIFAATSIAIPTNSANSYLAMVSLPNEIFADITNFLPNDDITDQMLLSRTFNCLVTPRLKKINQKIRSTNQSIESFMPVPEPDPNDNGWILQLDLERYKPVDPEGQRRMREVFENHVELRDCLVHIDDPDVRSTLLPRVKERMSLERFDDPTFLRIVGALVSTLKFRQEYNVDRVFRRYIEECYMELELSDLYPNMSTDDVMQIMHFLMIIEKEDK